MSTQYNTNEWSNESGIQTLNSTILYQT